MFILSQSGKGLINVNNIESMTVEGNFGKQKACIVTSNVILGLYENEKIAVDELDNIVQALLNDEKLYKMP